MPRRLPSLPATLAAFAGATLAAAPALAIQPDSWIQTTEADFQAGETDKTIVTNLGDVKLATGTEPVAEATGEASVFNDLQPLDGTLYIAAGPQGRILKRQGDAIEALVKLTDEQIFALDVYKGQLLAAVSGETSRLAVLENGELRTLAELPDVRYVWDMLVDGERIFVATGVDGRVLRVDPARLDAEAEENPGLTEVVDTNQANVLALGRDAQGRLYAGTDSEGLVYRLTPNQDGGYDAFVLYDAPEPEIGALLVRADGTVFAGTADAEQARPGRLEEAADEPAGRPEVEVQVETEPEDAPEPGDLPQVPPEADPIGDPEGDGPDASEGEPAPGNDAAPENAPANESMDEQVDGEPEADSLPVAADAEPAAPSSEQYDRLRSAIRAKLESARESGQLQAGIAMQAGRGRRVAGGTTRSRPVRPDRPTEEGNAVYRIDPQGFVAEVFRESVMILRIVEADGRLLVATGNEGQVFRVDPRAQETSTLTDIEAEQIPALVVTPDGAVLLGTANPAQLLRLDNNLAPRGTYTSPVMDASQISFWGHLDLTGRIPEGTSVLIETRSGNVADPEQAPWSEWSDARTLMPAPELPTLRPRQVEVDAPPARFLQYRLTLVSGDGRTPVIGRAETSYVTPNLPPRIASIQATYPEPPAPGQEEGDAEPGSVMNIEWEASDINEDRLVHRLEYRPDGSERWLLIEKDLDDTSYEWQTRQVPDGYYILRVIASDRPSNPPDMAETTTRRADPVLVDNTPPDLKDIETETDGQAATISGTAADMLSAVHSIGYAVDSEEDYRPVLPEDLIFDSTAESWTVTIPDLSAGPHVVTFRVRDRRGNTAYVPVFLNVEE